jgi:hypothetical protein
MWRNYGLPISYYRPSEAMHAKQVVHGFWQRILASPVGTGLFFWSMASHKGTDSTSDDPLRNIHITFRIVQKMEPDFTLTEASLSRAGFPTMTTTIHPPKSPLAYTMDIFGRMCPHGNLFEWRRALDLGI